MVSTSTWIKLFTSVASGAVSGFPPAAVISIISVALELLSDEGSQLEKLDAKVDSLISGPFHAALGELEDARQPWRTSAEQHEFIAKARSLFILAQGQQQDPYQRALSQQMIGMCWALLGNQADEAHWYQKALDSCSDSIAQELDVFNKTINNVKNKIFMIYLFPWIDPYLGKSITPAILSSVPFASAQLASRIFRGTVREFVDKFEHVQALMVTLDQALHDRGEVTNVVWSLQVEKGLPLSRVETLGLYKNGIRVCYLLPGNY